MSKKSKKKMIVEDNDGILGDLIEIGEKGKKRAKGFFNDFKKFITKGNVIDLAVALVIGTAFNNIVKGLVSYIITPCLSVLTNGISMPDWKYVLKPAVEASEGVAKEAEIAILYGEWLHTVIDFIIISFFIFIALRIIINTKSKLKAKEIEQRQAADRKRKEEEKRKAAILAEQEQKRSELFTEGVLNITKQSEILKEIRDILSTGKN